MSNTTRFAKYAGGLVLAGLASFANAAEISYDDVFEFTSNTVTSDGGVVSDTQSLNLDLSGFDSSLGTLQRVEITFDSGWSLGGTVYGYDGTPISFGGDSSMDFNAIGAAGSVSSELSVSLTAPTTSGDGTTITLSDIECTAAGSSAVDCDENSTGAGDFNGTLFDSDLSTSIDLAAFLSDIQITFTRDLIANLTDCTGTGGDALCSIENENNAWSGSFSVLYTYDEVAVPEPGTLAMFGLGLVGLGLARRKTAS